MSQVQVQNLTHRHEAILHFMLAHPTVAKGEVAERFGVTQAWLSVIINSQAFLEARAALTDQAFHETVLPLREKMIALADKTLDRLGTLIPLETNTDVVRKTAESVLAACGFGTQPAKAPGQINIQNNTTNNFGNASPDVLRRAQQRIGVTLDAEPQSTGQSTPRVGGPGEAPRLENQASGGGSSTPGDGVRSLTIHSGNEIRSGSGGGGDSPANLNGDCGGEGSSGCPEQELYGIGSGEEGERQGEVDPGLANTDLRYPEGSLPSIGEITRGSPSNGGKFEGRLHAVDGGGISPVDVREF